MLNTFGQYIKIQSRLYVHCHNCNGIFLCEGPLWNRQLRVANCLHCGYKFEIAGSYEKGSQDAGTILRLAAIVQKEEQMGKILKFILKHNGGIDRRKLETMLNKLGYREKVAQQLAYLGLIAASNDGRSFYCITYKGRMVLEAVNY